jgi:hypothetical protein
MISLSPHFREPEERLIQAIKTHNFEEATSILESGADPRVPDISGLTSVDYAQLSGNLEFFTHISKIARRINVDTVISRFPTLCETFLTLPDFRVSFNWKVRSWVPFVSAFCPSDTWVLTKVGSRLRIDTTLANWSGFRWTRGSISIYFDAGASEMLDSFLAVDNVAGTQFSVLREICESAEIESDIQYLMQLDLIKGFIQIDQFRRTPARSWLGFRVGTVTHDRQWTANAFDLSNAKIKFIHYYFEQFGEENPVPRLHEKTYKGRFWCSQDFPVQPRMLIPFLEALAPFRESSRNLLNLLGMFEDGMPVKGEISVFPTVKVEFSFDDFSGDIEAFRETVIPPVME